MNFYDRPIVKNFRWGALIALIGLVGLVLIHNYTFPPKKNWVVGYFDEEQQIGFVQGPIKTYEICVDLAESYQLAVQNGKEKLASIDEQDRTDIQNEAIKMFINIKCIRSIDRPLVNGQE